MSLYSHLCWCAGKQSCNWSVLLSLLLCLSIHPQVLQRLPSKIEKILTVPMADEQRVLYNELRTTFARDVDSAENKDAKIKGQSGSAMMMELRKVANHHLLRRCQFDDAKLRSMADIIVTASNIVENKFRSFWFRKSSNKSRLSHGFMQRWRCNTYRRHSFLILISHSLSRTWVLWPTSNFTVSARSTRLVTTSVTCHSVEYRWFLIWFNLFLTFWTPEDGIPTLRKLPYAASLRYTVRTACYRTHRKTVYLRHGV